MIVNFSLDEGVELLAAILPGKFHILIVPHEPDVALADPVALICVRLPNSLPSQTLVIFRPDNLRNIIRFMEATVSVFHLDVIGGMGLVHMRVVHIGSQIVQHNLLGKTPRTSHYSGEERC